MLSEAYSSQAFYGEKPAAGEALGLSVLIGPGSLMYAVSTAQFTRVHELGHVRLNQQHAMATPFYEQVPAIVQNHLLQRRQFDKVNVAVLNQQFTLVPQAYGNGDLKPLLGFATGATAVKTALVHHIKEIDFLYTIEPELLAYLERTFANAAIRHAGALSMSLLFGQHSLAQASIFLNISDGCMELAIKEKNSLLFYNVFNYESDEDILYYLLFTMEQFGLEPLHARLAIAAQRPVTDALMNSIKKYIRHVGFCAHDAAIVLNGELSALPQHYYFTLLNQHVCAL